MRYAVMTRPGLWRVAGKTGSYKRQASEASAGVQPGLFFRCADPAQCTVAMRKAAEAGNDLLVRHRIIEVLRIAQGTEQFHRKALVGRVFRVLVWQVEECAQGWLDLRVVPCSQRAARICTRK